MLLPLSAWARLRSALTCACRQEWRAVAELDSPLTFSAAASLHSHIYLFGGSSPAEEDESFTRRAQRCIPSITARTAHHLQHASLMHICCLSE